MSIQSNFPNLKPSLLLDFANTKQLDNRVTFTRSTPAVYYDGKTTAKAEQNLTLQSQAIGSSPWSVEGMTYTSSSTAPDGTSTATAFTEQTNTGTHRTYQSQTYLADTVYTISFYAKYVSRQYLQLNASSIKSGCRVIFDIQNGTVTDASTTLTTSITSVGNSWYRCVATITNDIGTNTYSAPVGGNSSSTGNGESYTGSGSLAFYIWGFQTEQRSSATAYTATTTQPITNYIPVLLTAGGNQPRFDCNPTTGESLGLLIEEQRTNELSYSADFSDAYWAKTNATVTANQNVAPDGTLSADLITATANIETGVYRTTAYTGNYANSVYVKKGTAQYFIINTDVPTRRVWFNLDTGTIANTEGAVTGSIVSVGNGWYRCAAVSNSPKRQTFFVGNSSTDSSSAVGLTIFLWGAQVEAGSFATSYIPTTSASATRTADIAVMTGTNFSSWFNYGQMTIYWEATGYYNDGGFEVFDLDSGSNTGRIRTRFSSASQVDQIDSTGGLPVSLDGGTVTANVFSKLATGLTQNSQALSFNNGAVVTSTAPFTSLPIPTAARIGTNWVPSEFLNGTIKKIAFYPIKATNAQLQALTS